MKVTIPHTGEVALHVGLSWVLVADEGVARIYQRGGRNLQLLTTIFPEPTEEWLDNNTVGRMASFTGQRHKYEPPMNESRRRAAQFAYEICLILGRAAKNHDFDRLIIIAAPRMLGLLRAKYDGELEKHIAAEIPKDLTHDDRIALEKALLALPLI